MKALILFTLFSASVLHAQTSSLSVGGGFYHTSPYTVGKTSTNAGSLAAVADYNYHFEKNIVAASVIYGPGINVVSSESGTTSYFEAGLLYGRELNISEYLGVEPFAGIGFYSLKDSTKYYQDNENYLTLGSRSGVAFPLRLNVFLNKNHPWNIGLMTNYSINSFANVFSMFAAVRFKF